MTEEDILRSALMLQGMTYAQLAHELQIELPMSMKKGWLGQALEKYLGALAGSRPVPDFPELSLELKSIPVLANAKACESTYVTTVALSKNLSMSWQNSACYHKLRRILWVPVEGDARIAFRNRRIGRAFLWSPSPEQERILREDWEYLNEYILQGRVEEINGSMGQYLHIRPKAAHSRALTQGINEEAELIATLPRGYYLRASFSTQLLSQS